MIKFKYNVSKPQKIKGGVGDDFWYREIVFYDDRKYSIGVNGLNKNKVNSKTESLYKILLTKTKKSDVKQFFKKNNSIIVN